jgi:hypothetical protein
VLTVGRWRVKLPVLMTGGLPSEVQHLWEERGELETYRFLFRQEGVAAWSITNSPWVNGIGLRG